MLHSEILGLYLRSFKKPATNPVSLMLSFEQGDFCLPLSHEKADLGGIEPNGKWLGAPFFSLNCFLFTAPLQGGSKGLAGLRTSFVADTDLATTFLPVETW